MTDQEVFDKVARHLLTQKKKSRITNCGLCAYRGEGGLKCAVGCLIPDEKYNPCMEGDVPTLLTRTGKYNQLAKILLEEGITNLDLCRNLQILHDLYCVRDWKRELRKAADCQRLDASVLGEFP